MENFELYIPPVFINPLNGQFMSGHKPFNKGIPMKNWMDGKKIKKVKKYLKLARIKGNETMPGANRKKIVAIKDGRLIAYNSAVEAEKILRQKGIKISHRNINKVCHGDDKHRKRAGGYFWHFADNINEYKDLLY
jgi:hypothetical protein